MKCKKPDIKSSETDQRQLKNYMNLSNVELGVLFNGNSSNSKIQRKLFKIVLFTKDKLKKIHNLNQCLVKLEAGLLLMVILQEMKQQQVK